MTIDTALVGRLNVLPEDLGSENPLFGIFSLRRASLGLACHLAHELSYVRWYGSFFSGTVSTSTTCRLSLLRKLLVQYCQYCVLDFKEPETEADLQVIEDWLHRRVDLMISLSKDPDERKTFEWELAEDYLFLFLRAKDPIRLKELDFLWQPLT